MSFEETSGYEIKIWKKKIRKSIEQENSRSAYLNFDQFRSSAREERTFEASLQATTTTIFERKKKKKENEKKKKKKRGRKRKSVDRFHRGWIVCPREDCGRVLVRVWVYCTRNRGECRGRAWWLNYPRQGRVCSGSQRLSASNDGTQASIQAASQHPHRVGLESFIDKPKFIFFRLWF